MGEWTKEPWCIPFGAHGEPWNHILSFHLARGDMRRAVACVNALSGHPDPEAFVDLAWECVQEIAQENCAAPTISDDGEWSCGKCVVCRAAAYVKERSDASAR